MRSVVAAVVAVAFLQADGKDIPWHTARPSDSVAKPSAVSETLGSARGRSQRSARDRRPVLGEGQPLLHRMAVVSAWTRRRELHDAGRTGGARRARREHEGAVRARIDPAGRLPLATRRVRIADLEDARTPRASCHPAWGDRGPAARVRRPRGVAEHRRNRAGRRGRRDAERDDALARLVRGACARVGDVPSLRDAGLRAPRPRTALAKHGRHPPGLGARAIPQAYPGEHTGRLDLAWDQRPAWRATIRMRRAWSPRRPA